MYCNSGVFNVFVFFLFFSFLLTIIYFPFLCTGDSRWRAIERSIQRSYHYDRVIKLSTTSYTKGWMGRWAFTRIIGSLGCVKCHCPWVIFQKIWRIAGLINVVTYDEGRIKIPAEFYPNWRVIFRSFSMFWIRLAYWILSGLYFLSMSVHELLERWDSGHSR